MIILNKKKLTKKIFKKINKFIILLFSSGIIVLLIELWHADVTTKPETWIKIESLETLESLEALESLKTLESLETLESLKTLDSLESLYFNKFSYPSEIKIDDNKSFTNIAEGSFIIDLHINNISENELFFSDLKFDMLQYQCDFPILSAKAYIENDNFMIDIINHSNQDLNNLDVYLYDDDKILQGIYDQEMNLIVQEIEADETKSLRFFSFEEIVGKNVNSWVLKPNVLLTDSMGNTLLINLKRFSLNKDEHDSFNEKINGMGFMISDKYAYDITPDIIINNEEIFLNEIVECIPAHEILELRLLVTSQVTCAFDLQMTYNLNGIEHTEEGMSFIIYNPQNANIKYKYIDEYIEIK